MNNWSCEEGESTIVRINPRRFFWRISRIRWTRICKQDSASLTTHKKKTLFLLVFFLLWPETYPSLPKALHFSECFAFVEYSNFLKHISFFFPFFSLLLLMDSLSIVRLSVYVLLSSQCSHLERSSSFVNYLSWSIFSFLS